MPLRLPYPQRVFLAGLFCLFTATGFSQTAFLDFNTVGQYTNNFSPWNDTGGVNGGGYAFTENTTNGVAGSGGVNVFQSTDTTATYKSAGWNLATNGATVVVSTLIYAAGGNVADKIQLGVINSTTNGLNGNAGVAFESFRFIPASTTTWSTYEQSRSGNVLTTSGVLGTVTVTPGHWYKFLVAVTNTSGGTGNLGTGCALYDYGTNGITPGANVITFSTVTTHTAQNIATNTAVYPALRITANAAVNAWDNFLVYRSNSVPVFTLKIANTNFTPGLPATFSALADGPGNIVYSWYSNNVLVAVANSSNYTVASVSVNLTNVAVVARNSNGAATNAVQINLSSPILLTGFNRDMVIESTASGPPYNAYALEYNPGEGTCFYQAGLSGQSYGLPASGIFNSVIDGTTFQLQPYTTNNALVMSSDTGISSGTLTLVNPATYNSISIVANSASATSTTTGTLTLNFADGSFYNTTYNAGDWFFNSGFALQGFGRINLTTGATTGSPTDPRLYQTTLNLAALLGATNKPVASLTFGQGSGANATAVYAVSGILSGTNVFLTAVITNLPATAIQATSATLQGQVVSNGGFAPTITFYYGPSNGGSNPANWANSVTIGVQTGNYSLTVTGLQASTTYYFSANAANIAGSSWASPSQSFSTTVASPPTVINNPASGVGATYATLNGQVISTGGAGVANVIVYYGLSDGGTNPASWNHSVAIGNQTNTYAQSVSGLSSNTIYYFTAEATNLQGAGWAAPSQIFTTAATNPPYASIAMLTYHNDNTRMGVNPFESQLTLTNVNTNSFGKLFQYAVDGFIYAQPLIMTNVSIPGKGSHNVVYVVTEHNSAYAFDADNNSGANAAPLWQVSFINPAAGITTTPNGDVGSTDITPEIGTTSTPVIDPVTGTMYIEVKTKEPGAVYVHRLHALDIATGLERTNFGSPVVISCTNYVGVGDGTSDDNDGKTPAHVLWNPLKEHCRPAMTLLNGVVYLSFASHGDGQPYHGWFFGYTATNLSQYLTVYNATPNGVEGGFWDGGGGPSVDAQGNLYFQTGNGTFDGNATISTNSDYAMSLIKLATTNNRLTMVDYFAPSNAVSLSGGDSDLGSAAPIILPDSAGSAAHPHLVVGGGKTPPIYLVDRDNMGRFNGTSGNNLIVQQFNGGSGNDRDFTPAFFNNTMYLCDGNNRIGAFKITNALFNTTPVETPDTYANKGGAGACISANGTSNAIMWSLYNDGGQSPATPAVLRAYNATNVAQELYTSAQIPTRDAAGSAVKFIIPTIVNGKVYVGAQYSLTVYGVAQSFVSTPLIAPNGGIFTNSVTITLTDSITGASIYYTLDGTTPTTNSIHYTAPFVLTNSAAVTAAAFKAGSVPSGTVSASFVNSSAVGNGVGLLGNYWANTTPAAFTTPGFNTPPTLTRTDAVVNFDWSSTPPATNVGPNTYVVEWTGTVEPQFNDTYTFYTTTDYGVMLWVNGQLLIDEWVDQAATTWSGQITLSAQQRYNIKMDYYQNGGGAQAQLFWSSPLSGPTAIVPQSQLFPQTNPPPVVAIMTPASGANYTAPASVTIGANAAAQFNPLTRVDFYIGASYIGSISNAPYTITRTGLAAGGYSLTAVAFDGSGLSTTSAPVSITVNPGTGLAYGLSNRAPVSPFLNMPTTYAGSLPAQLSGTGAFSDTPNRVAAAGLIPYQPNTPLWSDGAVKSRLMAVPYNGTPITANEQITFQSTNTWTFPSGTVFVKNFDLVVNQTNPAVPMRRLETRLLVRDINGAVYGVTYKWRPDNSDADLLSGSLTEAILVTNASGVNTQMWYYPSPADCLTCHTPVANYVLGVNTRQLNGNLTYAATGNTDNQLRTLNELGMFNPSFNETSISNFLQLYSLTNTSASLQDRARSYIEANCVQCHQPGGTGPTFDARFDTPLANQNITNYPANFPLGVDHACIVKAQDTWRSVLLTRINTTNSLYKMPPLARNLIDSNAVQVITAWINSLPGAPALPPPLITPFGGSYTGAVSVALSSTDPTATIYYTLDGSLPTTNSLRYINAFNLLTNATVSANASDTGYYNSIISSAVFAVQPLYFTSGSFTVGQQFQLNLMGAAGNSYVLQASTNLVNWFPISTNVSTTNQVLLVDPGATNFPYRYYRVLQQ